MTESAQDRDLRRLRAEYRWRAEAHSRAVRFHIAVNLALACLALFALKLDGPYYADAIAAGLFICGALTSFAGIMAVRASRAELSGCAGKRLELERQMAEHPDVSARAPTGDTAVTVALGGMVAFFLAAAFFTVWLTYVSPPEVPAEEDIQASTSPAIACSGFDL